MPSNQRMCELVKDHKNEQEENKDEKVELRIRENKSHSH
jgi:hypothetical protein